MRKRAKPDNSHIIMKPHSLMLFFVLPLTPMIGSCNKHNILDAEREKLEAERAALIKEMADLDRKIQSMPDAYNTTTLERKVETTIEQAAKLEAEADEKMKKWSGIEAKLLPLKKEADEYRAKFAP